MEEKKQKQELEKRQNKYVIGCFIQLALSRMYDDQRLHFAKL